MNLATNNGLLIDYSGLLFLGCLVQVQVSHGDTASHMSQFNLKFILHLRFFTIHKLRCPRSNNFATNTIVVLDLGILL